MSVVGEQCRLALRREKAGGSYLMNRRPFIEHPAGCFFLFRPAGHRRVSDPVAIDIQSVPVSAEVSVPVLTSPPTERTIRWREASVRGLAGRLS